MNRNPSDHWRGPTGPPQGETFPDFRTFGYVK